MSEISTNRFIYLSKIPESAIVGLYTELDKYSDCKTNQDFFETSRQLLRWAKKHQDSNVQVLVAASVEQAIAALRDERRATPFMGQMFDHAQLQMFKIEQKAYRLFEKALGRMQTLEDIFHASAAALNATDEGKIGLAAKELLRDVSDAGIAQARPTKIHALDFARSLDDLRP